MEDEREKKLPSWAQGLIRQLREQRDEAVKAFTRAAGGAGAEGRVVVMARNHADYDDNPHFADRTPVLFNVDPYDGIDPQRSYIDARVNADGTALYVRSSHSRLRVNPEFSNGIVIRHGTHDDDAEIQDFRNRLLGKRKG